MHLLNNLTFHKVKSNDIINLSLNSPSPGELIKEVALVLIFMTLRKLMGQATFCISTDLYIMCD